MSKGTIQSIIFDKSIWTIPKSKLWLKRKNYTPIKSVDITRNFYRFRIKEPNDNAIYRMINIGAPSSGIKAVYMRMPTRTINISRKPRTRYSKYEIIKLPPKPRKQVIRKPNLIDKVNKILVGKCKRKPLKRKVRRPRKIRAKPRKKRVGRPRKIVAKPRKKAKKVKKVKAKDLKLLKQIDKLMREIEKEVNYPEVEAYQPKSKEYATYEPYSEYPMKYPHSKLFEPVSELEPIHMGYQPNTLFARY